MDTSFFMQSLLACNNSNLLFMFAKYIKKVSVFKRFKNEDRSVVLPLKNPKGSSVVIVT